MEIAENISLKPFNTFGVDVKVRRMARFKEAAEVSAFAAEGIPGPFLVLGGGSNMLFVSDYEGTLLRFESKGIRTWKEEAGEIFLSVSAGETWDDFVHYCVAKGYYGAENLSLIPGTAGAGPVQNIGAYGVELKDIFHELEAVDLRSGETRTFGHDACRFGYRDSIFKQEYRNRFLITSVVLRLSKVPALNISYGSLNLELEKRGIRNPDLTAVREIICGVRRSKLPDPSVTGNAGSFFKNPEVTPARYETLAGKFPGIAAHFTESGTYKLAAGWLIEQCGWKGRRVGNAGVHDKQALVLVNLGEATGAEILELSAGIQKSVNETFGIMLEREVQVVGTTFRD